MSMSDAKPDLDYEPCPHCHRPSWAHVRWMLDRADRDGYERARLEYGVPDWELPRRPVLRKAI